MQDFSYNVIQYYTTLYNIIHTLCLNVNYLQINKQYQSGTMFNIILYKLSIQTYRMRALHKSLIFFDYLIILRLFDHIFYFYTIFTHIKVNKYQYLSIIIIDHIRVI